MPKFGRFIRIYQFATSFEWLGSRVMFTSLGILLNSISLVKVHGGETTAAQQCISCASTSYLSAWSQLMQHYFPPRNFTDDCWNPNIEIGVVTCSSACFTLIQEVDDHSKCFGFLYIDSVVCKTH